MRNTLIITILVLLNGVSKAQGWKEIHRFNPQQTLQKVKFYNEKLGFTVGSLYNGSTENIHITRDGGKTWENASSGYTSMRFMDIFIQNSDTIFMSGNDGLIIRSYDSGKTWKTMTSNTKEQLWGIYFTDEKTGHAVGSNGIIIRTTNGGLDWNIVQSGISNLFYDVFFLSKEIGFASGSNVLMKTVDGGSSWNKVENFPFEAPADWIRCIKMVNSEVGYACADIGRIYKTLDGGESWERLNSGVQDPLFELDFSDVDHGIVCGFNGVILSTVDGGINWTPMLSPLGTENLYSIDVVSKDVAYICTHTGKILQLNSAVNTNQLGRNNIVEKLYPNPSNSDQVTLLLNREIHENYLNLEVCNSIGDCHTALINWIDKDKININISEEKNGLLFIRKVQKEGSYSIPFIKL
ncbi:MAG: YCF48-related protein [Saprospiraceae bacterium]